MKICAHPFILFLMSFCWAGLCLHAQPAQLDFRQYDTDDGLPSSETYLIVEDRSGYIWIGTDNGVARFDGYEFEVFDADDGLEDSVVFGIVEDADGRIWVSTYSGKVYFFEGGRFYPYKHNSTIEEIRRNSGVAVLLEVTPDSSFIISWPTSGLFKLNSRGARTRLTDAKSIYLYEFSRNNQSITIPTPHGFFYDDIARDSDSLKVFILTSELEKPYGQAKSYAVGPSSSSFSAVFHTEGGTECVITNADGIFILEESGRFKHAYPSAPNLYDFFMPGLGEDTYWAFLKRGGGLEYHDFRGGGKFPRVFKQLFGHSPTSGLFDKNGGFWVSTLDAGIFYCPYPEQLVYLKDDYSQNNQPFSIVLTGREDFYAGYEDGTIFHYDDKSSSLQQIQEDEFVTPERIFDLYYDSLNRRVFTPSYSFTHPIPEGEELNDKTVSWFEEASGKRRQFKYFNKLKGVNSRVLYGSFPIHLATIRLDSAELVEFQAGYVATLGIAHVLGLHPDGTKLVGTLNGILELKEDGSTVSNNLGIPELSNRVEFITDLGGKQLLFGTRGDGVVYMGPDTTYVIRERDGLASDMIRDIHVSDSGTIWISTLTGLSRLDFSEDGKTYKVRTFGKEHGLPSQEIYQTDTYQDEVWLATGAGVVKFEEPAVVMDSPRPVIRSVVLNGEQLTDTASSYAFPSGRQNVSVQFSTINFILGDEVMYRYRLDEANDWQYIQERAVNYPNLGPGEYQFAVQSRNQDGIWSESTVMEMSIATPWYATVWAAIGGVLLLVGALSTFFLLRERRKKWEQDLLLQITQLEHAALHAQMNPHFVFNALNSIQNFVLENDAKQAATYLSRFARVIRQTLRSSVDGQHHLNEELMMLETYLGLEKLRFKEGFTYSVEVDPKLEKDKIVLPPLLIQPFVENAIIHGLKGRKKGGQILVRFTGTADNLIVVIEDNGKGYDPDEPAKPDSLGMNITRRRLDMMNLEENGASGMEIDPLYSDSGALCGTRITLYIRPLTSLAPASAPGKKP